MKLSVPKLASQTTPPPPSSTGGLKMKFKFNRSNSDKDSPCKITVEAPLLLKKGNKNDEVVVKKEEPETIEPRVPPLHINLSQIGKFKALLKNFKPDEETP